MAADLERLSKQFAASGNADIALGVSAWAPFARARGLETFSTTTAIPEWAIRLPDLTIGGKTPKQLEKALDSGGFKVGDWARDIIRSKDFTTLPDQQTLSLVRAKVSDLGFKDPATYSEVCQKAEEFGLEKCLPETAVHYRLAYKDQPMNEWLTVAMEPISDSNGHPSVFELYRPGDGLWLRGYWVYPASQWSPEAEFVFTLRK